MLALEVAASQAADTRFPAAVVLALVPIHQCEEKNDSRDPESDKEDERHHSSPATRLNVRPRNTAHKGGPGLPSGHANAMPF